MSMTNDYCKLASGIILSTIWREDDKTRILWITMLAVKDREHRVMASVPGLAAVANISIEDTRKGLLKLMSPDPDSRTKEHEGRRIKEIDGGWFVINGEKFRNYLSKQERNEYQARLMAERRKKEKAVSKELAPVSTKLAPLAQTEADTEADTEKTKTHSASPPSSPSSMSSLGAVNGEHHAFIKGWCQNFKAHFGFDYSVDGGRDGKAVKELLRHGILRLDLLEIAKSAWARASQPPKSFNCEQASTIHGFKDYLTQIRVELKNGHSATPKPIRRSAMDIRTIMQAKEKLCSTIRFQYASETAMDTIWSDDDKRIEYFKLKKEIKALNTELSEMV